MPDDPLYQFVKNKAAWRKSAGEIWRERRESGAAGDDDGDEGRRLKERARAAYLRVGGDPAVFEAGWPQIRARLLRTEAERAKKAADGGG